MKQTVNKYDFQRAFEAAGRADQFSYDGLLALFEFLDEIDEECGTDTELDVIALCCDFAEYDNLAAFVADYGEEFETIEDVENETCVIRVGDAGFIVQNF